MSEIFESRVGFADVRRSGFCFHEMIACRSPMKFIIQIILNVLLQRDVLREITTFPKIF
jgi:hypothetical protein